MYCIKNTYGQFWTGECWGTREARELYRREDLMTLNIDRECSPETFFDNAPDDIGWGTEEDWISASAEKTEKAPVFQWHCYEAFENAGGGIEGCLAGNADIEAATAREAALDFWGSGWAEEENTVIAVINKSDKDDEGRYYWPVRDNW